MVTLHTSQHHKHRPLRVNRRTAFLLPFYHTLSSFTPRIYGTSPFFGLFSKQIRAQCASRAPSPPAAAAAAWRGRGRVPIAGWSLGGVGPDRGLREGGRRRWCAESGAGGSRRQGEQQPGQPQVAATRPHTHTDDALMHLTMHISTKDLHCCKPARLLQRAPSGGRPCSRPPATAPPRSATLYQQQQTVMED